MDHSSKALKPSISKSKFSVKSKPSVMKPRAPMTQQQYEIVDELDSRKRNAFRSHLNTVHMTQKLSTEKKLLQTGKNSLFQNIDLD